jgi:serine/threonine protein kinase
MPLKEILTLFLLILIKLNKMHSINIYHRDIKPANFLFVENDNDWRLSDFGASIISNEESCKIKLI